MSNTNGMTLSQFRAELRAAYVAGGIEAQRAKRKQMLAGFGPKVDVNPYGYGSYTVSPRGYIFSCGAHVFADFGYQPERTVEHMGDKWTVLAVLQTRPGWQQLSMERTTDSARLVDWVKV